MLEPRSTLADLRERSTCSIDEAAGVLGIGRSTAYAAARDGSLPTLRVSHRLLVPTAKLIAMLGGEGECGCCCERQGSGGPEPGTKERVR